MWKEAHVANFKVLLEDPNGGTEINHKKKLRIAGPGPRFEQDTSRIRLTHLVPVQISLYLHSLSSYKPI
jgi:hypothetical protein